MLGRALISVVGLGIYGLLFVVLYGSIGGNVAPLGVLPALVGGSLLGRNLGALFSLLCIASIGGLFVVVDGGPMPTLVLLSSVVPTSLTILVVGVVTGWASDSAQLAKRRARRLIAEVDRRRQVEDELSRIQAQIDLSSVEILATSQQQERGAIEQSSAAEETRLAMETLLGSSRQIVAITEAASTNAQRSLDNHHNVMDRIAALTTQMDRIVELLGAINAIADKSDLLSLNAALEGARAGEAGQGFTLVAQNIQRLAESVIAAVRDIRELTVDVEAATTSSVLATEEGKKLAGQAVDSAQQIRLTAQQQLSGTELAMGAIQEISLVARQTAEGSTLLHDSTRRLADLAQSLRRLTDELRRGDSADPRAL